MCRAPYLGPADSPIDRFCTMPCVLATPKISLPTRKKRGENFLLVLPGAIVRFLAASAFHCGWVSADCARMRLHRFLRMLVFSDVISLEASKPCF